MSEQGAEARAERETGPVGRTPTRERESVAAEFTELTEGSSEHRPAALSMLYDLSMPVAIELGRARLAVQEILALGRGSVVELDRLAGEPVDVFVGDRRFAEGEVVVGGEHDGGRIPRTGGQGPGVGEGGSD